MSLEYYHNTATRINGYAVKANMTASDAEKLTDEELVAQMSCVETIDFPRS